VDDILHLALSSCYENILKAAKIEIWEMTYDESNKQSDKKIYSVAKLNLKQELMKKRETRYLRHLSDHNLKLFHDAIQNNSAHIDMHEQRRQTWNLGR
jgi:hypothetical protein